MTLYEYERLLELLLQMRNDAKLDKWGDMHVKEVIGIVSSVIRKHPLGRIATND